MYSEFRSRRGRLKPEEIKLVASSLFGESPDWNHLTSRSLLNRDSQGFFKFSHKSILEFLVVLGAIDGDNRAIEVQWTDFMKELLVSWGHSDAGFEKSSRAQEMLISPSGRANITPLYDPLDARPVRGLPDFERCAARRQTLNGFRIAPPEWRASAISIQDLSGHGLIKISDADYDLDWFYVERTALNLYTEYDMKLVELLKFFEGNPGKRAPSYEQFVSLLEGLHSVGRDLLPDGKLFLIGDKPGRYEHLLVQLNSEISSGSSLKVIDKQRRINNTSCYLNCYRTGLSVRPTYGTDIRVEQIYLHDRGLAQEKFLN